MLSGVCVLADEASTEESWRSEVAGHLIQHVVAISFASSLHDAERGYRREPDPVMG